MTDIVERLRACHGIPAGDPDCCCTEAAAEIERLHADYGVLKYDYDAQRAEIGENNDRVTRLLTQIVAMRAEIEQLRTALKEIEWSNNTKWQADRARAVLEPKP